MVMIFQLGERELWVSDPIAIRELLEAQEGGVVSALRRGIGVNITLKTERACQSSPTGK